MGGEFGRWVTDRSWARRDEVHGSGVDEHCREYYDLYGMDWEVIKETRRRDFRAGILGDRIAACVFLVFGIVLALCAWSFHDFLVSEFGPFEWIIGFGGLGLGIGGCIQSWNSARWRESVIRRYEKPDPQCDAREASAEKQRVLKQSYF